MTGEEMIAAVALIHGVTFGGSTPNKDFYRNMILRNDGWELGDDVPASGSIVVAVKSGWVGRFDYRDRVSTHSTWSTANRKGIVAWAFC